MASLRRAVGVRDGPGRHPLGPRALNGVIPGAVGTPQARAADILEKSAHRALQIDLYQVDLPSTGFGEKGSLVVGPAKVRKAAVKIRSKQPGRLSPGPCR